MELYPYFPPSGYLSFLGRPAIDWPCEWTRTKVSGSWEGGVKEQGPVLDCDRTKGEPFAWCHFASLINGNSGGWLDAMRFSRVNRDNFIEAAAAAPAKSTAVEDVIDWDDDAPLAEPAVPTKPSTSTATAAPIKQVPNPTAVPSQKVDIDPSTTHDLKVVRGESKAGTASTAAPGNKATPSEQINGADVKPEEKPAVDYSIGLSATDLEAELAKRKARAEKFGIVEDSSTALEQAKKAIERAKRFGTVTEDAAIVKGLDEALPERTKKRERGNDVGGNSRGGKRRDFRRDKGRPGKSGGHRASVWFGSLPASDFCCY
ncbi:SAP domain-containing protein [Histoplasma capsulatum H143]|uniref:SAP domain-containing protein n=1 Tax=Ajellomyces capsulatus (strain H143) TaxID=544712 RepID=C6HA11_AJECH|nr:SAP domain-containing protein [Histoplasma capsulatum H143]